MSFNLGLSNNPMARLGGLSSVGIYLYEDIFYRQWIAEVALAFYEGRQDEFIWLDLVKQFRNPEKQQILPLNLTKEVIDSTSILYRNAPIYRVVDENGKLLKEDQKLWEEVMEQSRYLTFMDKLDRWCNLMGTVLVKVGFVDPETGTLVKKTEGGIVQLDMLHGGVYDLRHGASPYYITELMIGFGSGFSGFGGNRQLTGGQILNTAQMGAGVASSNIGVTVNNFNELNGLNSIYWGPQEHTVEDHEKRRYKTKNPYGIIPAVPFFNQDPAHYYFLPVNEPLIYANHAINMRITDLNHIAKFQSFGIPVVSGIERPTSIRQGRPTDDFNVLRGGNAASKFGGIGGISGFGAGGAFRSYDSGMSMYRDGNADANSLGFSIGPDTAIAVGKDGDFRFEHPKADINGLIKTIQSMADMVRISNGLRPKHQDSLPASGFALMMDKMGVLENNIRRGKLFAEREQQLFQVIKKLYNIHHNSSGTPKFSENARLTITYVPPEFPVDPMTNLQTVITEQQIWNTGDIYSIQKLYPHMSEVDIKKIIKKRREDQVEQQVHNSEITTMEQAVTAVEKADTNLPEQAKSNQVTGKIDNRVKHAMDSGKQPGKGHNLEGKEKK